MPKEIFGPTVPVDDRQNKFRSVIALSAIFFGLVFTFGAYVIGQSKELTEVSSFFANLPRIEKVSMFTAEAEGGGDLVVEPPTPEPPKLPQLTGQPIDITDFSANNMIVKDIESGALLYGKDEYKAHPIASITKLMSALVFLEREHDWDVTATVIPDDIVDTHMYAGDTYTLDELWFAALVGSSNKAIMTLMDASGWPREAFVERMNQKARELGMRDTRFVDPTGLKAENISTPSDIIILLNEALKKEKIVEALSTDEYNLFSKERDRKHHMWSTNWLLLGWVPSDFAGDVIGKTGYIGEAGYNFTGRIYDGRGHGVEVVVFGTKSNEARFTEVRDLAKWAFANYTWPDQLEN